MVNGSQYYRALESDGIASALSTALTITRARSESINADSLNSNFLQLERRSGGRPQQTVYPRRLPVNTVVHTALAGIEPTTFRLLVRRATSNATGRTFEQRVTLYLGKLISPSSALTNHSTKSIHANVILKHYVLLLSFNFFIFDFAICHQ